MDTYFFVPATKLNKIPAIKDLGTDEIIVDFEDAILEVDRERLISGVRDVPGFADLWYRIPVHHHFTDKVLDLGFLTDFLNLGARKLVIPKLISKVDFESVFHVLKTYEDINLLLLIEHPRLLVEMPQILGDSQLGKAIFGIGLGSHDLMTFMGSEHSAEHFYFPRIQTLYLAKAYGKMAIDIASMNIADRKGFEEEILFGFEHGFEGKFIVHPQQFEWLISFEALNEKRIEWASKIIAALPANIQGKDVEPFILDGQIIEKPHVEKALSILNRFNNEK